MPSRVEAGIEPYEVRLRNLVEPHEMPFDNITNKHFDSGDYPEAVRRAVAAIDLPAVRARQRRGEPDGRRIGFGLAVFCEQGAHGTSVYHGWGIPMVPGREPAVIRLTPDGVLEVRAGVHSHGQSMETTLAQIAHDVLGIDTERVRIVLGDTGVTPYSTGTWGSRSIVMAGGAVGQASKELRQRLMKIGAWLLSGAGRRRAVGRRRSCRGGRPAAASPTLRTRGICAAIAAARRRSARPRSLDVVSG